MLSIGPIQGCHVVGVQEKIAGMQAVLYASERTKALLDQISFTNRLVCLSTHKELHCPETVEIIKFNFNLLFKCPDSFVSIKYVLDCAVFYQRCLHHTRKLELPVRR